MRLRAFAALSLLLVAFHVAVGQTKLPIYLHSKAEDPVGKTVVFSLREAIRRSASYELSDAEQAVLGIEIISLDAEEDGADAGHRSLISLAGLVVVSPCADHHLFLHQLFAVGSRRADEAGRQILVDLDDAWTAAKQEMKNRHDKLKCDVGSLLK